MTSSKDEHIRTAVAEQAADWFVADDEGPLDGRESAELVGWLKTSPVHVEEFLRVAAIARDLDGAGAALGSVQDLIARAQGEDTGVVQRYWSRTLAAVETLKVPRWQTAAVTMAVVGLLTFGVLWLSRLVPLTQGSAPAAITVLHMATHHGEQKVERLADASLLHLNSDTAVTIRYTNSERLIVLESGEADFEVAHEAKRPFRVMAGAAVAVARGTQFDVRLKSDSTVVTVIEGTVGVALSHMPRALGADHERLARLIEVHSDQQVSVSPDKWPAAPIPIDAHRATGWLHRQIAFDHEPLAQVAQEFNRYAEKPIEIATPELRALEISGVFSIDDTEAFLAFLRSIEGVRVEVTATQIRVSQK